MWRAGSDVRCHFVHELFKNLRPIVHVALFVFYSNTKGHVVDLPSNLFPIWNFPEPIHSYFQSVPCFEKRVPNFYFKRGTWETWLGPWYQKLRKEILKTNYFWPSESQTNKKAKSSRFNIPRGWRHLMQHIPTKMRITVKTSWHLTTTQLLSTLLTTSWYSTALKQAFTLQNTTHIKIFKIPQIFLVCEHFARYTTILESLKVNDSQAF